MASRPRKGALTHTLLVYRSRAELTARLRDRKSEIEQAVVARVYAVADPRGSTDEYSRGLRSSISAAIEFALTVIEFGEERAPSPPPPLLAQARLAARSRVGLDTVLRRYLAGYVLLSDFLIEEAEYSGLQTAAVRQLLRAQAVLDALLAAVSEEYQREVRKRSVTSEQRRAARVERLLSGEALDTSHLGYDIDGFHLGAIGSGPGVEDALQTLASTLDAKLLSMRRERDVVWGWLGKGRPFDARELRAHVHPDWPAGAFLGIGEPGEGISGWRLTHRQAYAALRIAHCGDEPIVRYADIALVAAILADDLLTGFLRRAYLEPLASKGNRGNVARETLRAYFASGRNLSSAAAVLGVSRRTVANRLRGIEGKFGRQLNEIAGEVEAALRLDALDGEPAQ